MHTNIADSFNDKLQMNISNCTKYLPFIKNFAVVNMLKFQTTCFDTIAH